MTISFYIHSFMLSLFVSSLCMLIPFVQAEEEVRELQKKMQQLENDLDQTQEKLMNANQRLEEKEKALQNVSNAASCSRPRRRWRRSRKS